MPKMKTCRAAAKRFKKTGTGKLKRNKASAAIATSFIETFFLSIVATASPVGFASLVFVF